MSPLTTLKKENGLIDSLSKIDWNFTEKTSSSLTHMFHPYPARFIPHIPRTFIEIFTQEGNTVYDPFCGCGTTCIEANSLNRNAIGNDVNELAVLIAKVKSFPLSNFGNDELLEFINNLKIQYKKNLNNGYTPKIPEQIAVDWFEDFIVNEIALVMEGINKLSDIHLKEFFKVALSSILVNVSRQDSDTRYVRVEKTTAPMDVINKFERQLTKMLKQMANSHSKISGGITNVKVADSRHIGAFPENTADFAVTSPPYPNAYDYHLYHRHRLLWLGMSPKKLKDSEIGSHAHYSCKNALTEKDFEEDMRQVMFATSYILKKGKYFVLVIGDSILKGRKIQNNKIIIKLCDSTPFTFVSEFSRIINSKRKSFNPRHGNICSENLILLRNDKQDDS